MCAVTYMVKERCLEEKGLVLNFSEESEKRKTEKCGKLTGLMKKRKIA